MAADSRVIFSTELDDTGVKNGLNNLGSTIKRLAFGAAGVMALRAIGTALGNVARSAMQYNSQMEQYYTSFSTLLGSEQAAAEKIAYLKDYAAKTPFEMTDLANAEKTLLGFGIASDKADAALQKLGDISQGNSERFSSLALVYGQMSSTGKLMGQDLLQMINAGFNPLTAIAETTGTSIGDLKQVMAGGKTSAAFKAQLKDAQKEVKKLGDGASEGAKMLAQIGAEGQISSDLVEKSMEIATSSGGRFYQAMEKQSRTAAGLISTLKDNVNMLGGEAFASLSESAKAEALPAALEYVDTLTKALKENGITGMMGAFGEILGDIAGKASSFAPQITTMAVNIIKSFATGIKKNASTIAKGLADAIKAAATGLVSVLPVLLDTGISMALELIDGLADAIPDMMPTLVDSIIETIVSLLMDIPRFLSVGLKVGAAVMEGIARGLATLMRTITGYAGTAAEQAKASITDTLGRIKSNIVPNVSAEDQEKLTAAIQTGIDAADEEIKIKATFATDRKELFASMDAAFADGKLTKKEGNQLGNAMKTYVDAGVKEANDYVAEKLPELQTTLSGFVNDSGAQIFTTEEIDAYKEAVSDKMLGLQTELTTAYDEYNTLKAQIVKAGSDATAEEYAQLEAYASKITEIRSQIAAATNEAIQVARLKGSRVQQGSGTAEDFVAAVAYTDSLLQDKLDKQEASVQEQLSAIQAMVDAGTITAEEAVQKSDAIYTADTNTRQSYLAQYNADIAALYAGMEKQYPEAAAALEKLAKLRDQYVLAWQAVQNAGNVDYGSDEFKASLSELFEGVTGIALTPEEITAMNPYARLAAQQVLDQAAAVVQEEFDTYTPEQKADIAALYANVLGMDESLTDGLELSPEMLTSLDGFATNIYQGIDASLKAAENAPAMTDNPLVGYLETLLDADAFEGLDASSVSSGILTAIKATDLMTGMDGVGSDALDGIVTKLNGDAKSLTGEDFANVLTGFNSGLREVFDSHSPAKAMHPIGADIIGGVVEGMNETTPDVEDAGASIVGAIATGVKQNSTAKNAVRSNVNVAIATGKSNAYSGGRSIGSNIMRGVNDGLTGMSSQLNGTMREIVASLLKAARAAAGVRSPSTLFRDQLGKYLAQGIGVGFTGTMNSDVLPAIATSIGTAAKAGQELLDNTLLAKVQRITGLQLPNVSGLTNAIMRGSAIQQTAGVTNSNSTTTVDARQIITFEYPMQAPDEIARAIRRTNTYGLAGART